MLLTFQYVHYSVGGGCEPGWDESALGHCYQMFVDSGTAWDTADNNCFAIGGDLPILDTEEKINDILDLYGKILNIPINKY